MTKGALIDSQKRARRLVMRQQVAFKCRKSSLPKGQGGKKGKRQARSAQQGCAFSKAEVNCILELLEYHCPIGQEQWELVMETHNHAEEFLDCKVLSLCNKFWNLCSKKLHSRETKPLPIVSCALWVWEKMQNSTDADGILNNNNNQIDICAGDMAIISNVSNYHIPNWQITKHFYLSSEASSLSFSSLSVML